MIWKFGKKSTSDKHKLGVAVFFIYIFATWQQNISVFAEVTCQWIGFLEVLRFFPSKFFTIRKKHLPPDHAAGPSPSLFGL